LDDLPGEFVLIKDHHNQSLLNALVTATSKSFVIKSTVLSKK